MAHGNGNGTFNGGFILLGFFEYGDIQILLFFLFLIAYLLCITGNMLLLLIIMVCSHLHTPMYLLLANLSFVDICLTSLIFPRFLLTFFNLRSISLSQCMLQVYLFIGFENILSCSCGDIFKVEVAVFVEGILLSIPSFVLTISSYVSIISVIMKIKTVQGRQKAFSTCSSHVTVITLLYLSLICVYFQPPVTDVHHITKTVSLLNTILIPLLNPILYSLRNKEFCTPFVSLYNCRLSHACAMAPYFSPKDTPIYKIGVQRQDLICSWKGFECCIRCVLGVACVSVKGLRIILIRDVMISITSENKIHTTLYRKPSATNNLLRWDSFHPIPFKMGIPKGQYLRVRRNCSTIDEFKTKAKELRGHFKAKGYPNRCLKRAYQRALDSDRNHLQEVLAPNVSITARRGKNLRDLLAPSHFKTEIPSPTTWLQTRLTVKDSMEKEAFTITSFFNCNTSGIVYLLTCECNKKYVGKTFRPFKKRIQEHIRS
ncbi:olfactory receptor 1038-like, partial [Pelobates cultripes]